MDGLDVLSLPEAKEALNLTAVATHDGELPKWITTVSRRLDRLCGPVVQRTVTSEKHDGGARRVFLRHHPNTSITSIVEYDGTVATTLTAETNATKPAHGYLAEDYEPDPSLLSSIVYRRSSGADATFTPGRKNVAVTYMAGRFSDAASVDERYKTAARLMLLNLWRSQQDGTGLVSEFDVPQSNFPRFAVPRAVRELLDGEIQDPMPL